MMTAQYQAALHSYVEGRYEEAMQQFSELLYEDPRNPKLHIWLGATFRKAGKTEYAKAQYQQVLTLTDDPDLLDLASTSLAQIQNKLANKALKTVLPKAEDRIPENLDNLHDLSSSKKNGLLSSSHEASQAIATNDNLTLIAPPSTNSIPKSKNSINPHSNGIVPPPPTIAALLKNQVKDQVQVQVKDQEQQRELSVMDKDTANRDIADQDTVEEPTSSILNETIANIQKVNQKSKKTKKAKNHQIAVEFPPLKSVESVLFRDQDKPKLIGNKLDSTPIALEDMFKFSSVAQKITLWGALVATIPAIALGIAAYQVGDRLLLSKVNQGQQSEAIALAKGTGNFLKQQATDVEVLKTLLISTEVGQNNFKSLLTLPIVQQRQYKQQLTNRLSLYSQAYPQYASISVFSMSGELIAQSTNSKILQTINPNTLDKVASIGSVLISNPVVGQDGASFYAVVSVKNPASQKVGMVLQVEIPVKTLVNQLNTNVSGNFFVIDSANKYIASSQLVKIGEDASSDFAMLPELRSAQSPNLRDVAKSDRNAQILAYAPVPNMQSYGMLSWDLLTTIDKATALSGSQNLLLIIATGIAITPLFVGAIAYVLSRKLSSRLKHIRLALRDLGRVKADTATSAEAMFLGTLSVEGNDELSDISLSINKMSEQFQTMMQKQEQEKQRLQVQVVKLFKVLSKLARQESREVKDQDLSDENILVLGKKVRAEMIQRNAEAESNRKQKEDIQKHLVKMLRDMQSLADGNLTVSTRAINGDLEGVSIFFDEVMRGLQNIIGQVKSSANQVNFSLGQNEQAIANLASVSQRQVDTVTRSLNTAQMLKLSATAIVNNSQQAVQSSLIVAEKISDSDRSIDAVMEKVGELQNTVSTTAKRVKHLGEVSQKIGLAISAINEIAIKTNFLSINASLEAARTGDVGGAFVVVAEEVGELAARSVAATKEVESLLGMIQRETNEVMTSIELGSNQVSESNILAIAAKDSLQQITQISQQIDGLMSAITIATISQVQTSEGVASLMKDISHIAKRTLTSSSEVSKFIKSTKQYSGDLQQSLANIKTR